MDKIERFYQLVFKVAKHFLDQSKRFTIAELQTHNDPTYKELAEAARELAGVIEAVAHSGGWAQDRISLNARQAALLMEQMAIAIAKEDEGMLERAASDLDRMPFI